MLDHEPAPISVRGAPGQNALFVFLISCRERSVNDFEKALKGKLGQDHKLGDEVCGGFLIRTKKLADAAPGNMEFIGQLGLGAARDF